MTSWSTTRLRRYVQRTIGLAVALFCLAGPGWAQSAAGGVTLPPLPGVEDEGAAAQAAAQPQAPPALPGAAVAETPAATATPSPAAPAKKFFASVEEAQDRIREAFAARNYSAVVNLANQIRAQFPDATFMRYYETTALLHLRETASDRQKLPYKQMEMLPLTSSTPAPTPTVIPTASLPAATGSPAAQAPGSITPVATTPSSTTPAAATPSTPSATPAPAASRPVTRQPVAPPQQIGGFFSDLMDMARDNPALAYGGAGGGVLVIALLAFVMLRKRAGPKEEADLEEKLRKVKTPGPAAEKKRSAPAAAMAAQDAESTKPKPRPGGTTAVFRQSPAVPQGARPVPAEPAAPAPPAREPERMPPPAEPRYAPVIVEPVFSLMDDEPPSAAARDPREENLAIFENILSFDDDVFEKPAPAQSAAAQPAPPRAAQPSPPPRREQVAESLFIEDPLPSFAFPLAADLSGVPDQGHSHEDLLTVAPESHTEDLLTVAPEPAPVDLPAMSDIVAPRHELSQGWQTREKEPAFSPDEIALASEATQTAYGATSLRASDATIDATLMGDMTEAPRLEEPKPEEPQVFQAFRPGETVKVRFKPEPEPAAPPRPARVADESEPTRISQSAPEVPEVKEVKKAAPADPTADVFEREYNQGLKDAEAKNWVGAIHHLSIAAALRPGALDVKDRLREARRMRSKELEGRS